MQGRILHRHHSMLSKASFVLYCVLVCVFMWTARAVKDVSVPKLAKVKSPPPLSFHETSLTPLDPDLWPWLQGVLYTKYLFISKSVICLCLSRAVCAMVRKISLKYTFFMSDLKIVLKSRNVLVKSRPNCTINNTLKMDQKKKYSSHRKPHDFIWK